MASILLRPASFLGRPPGIEVFSGWNLRAMLANILHGTNLMATGRFANEAFAEGLLSE